MTEQTKLDWEFGKGKPHINPDTLRRKIIESVLQQGFVIDFGNGIVAENCQEPAVKTAGLPARAGNASLDYPTRR